MSDFAASAALLLAPMAAVNSVAAGFAWQWSFRC